ncbi:MAG: Uma2 family endonuclease [Saprospiraceae bacterium]|jgi:Uma2 family endonuclease
MITSLNQLDFNKKYNYSDYILWQFQERVELLKGKLFPMAAPNVNHQRISSNLHLELGLFLRNKQCDLFAAPFDVRLPLSSSKVTDDKIDTVIQPDLCVVCDENKLTKQSCVGAPDLIVEILSPGNSRREMKDKFELYEEAGVLEYWVIDPERKAVFVYHLDKNTDKYVAQLPTLTDEDVLESRIFEGLKVELSDVFPKD